MNKPSRKTTAIILILASVSTAVLPAISPVQAPQLLVADFIWSLTGVRTVTFSSSTSGGTSPYFIEWTFGDGGTGQGSPVIHPYAAEGNYAVNMSVLDSANNRAFKVQTVTVTNYTPGSFAVAGDIGPVGRPNDVSRQSLLRLGNTTGLNFFLADGYLAGGFYYRNEAAWCSDFQAHLPQGTGLVIVAGETDTGWTSVPFDDIIYDTNGNGVYNVGSDTLLFNGWGGSSKLAGPSDGSPIATDSRLVYVDSNSNHHWDQGEAVVYAYDGANTAMRDYYPVMVGPISSVGSTMSSDSKIRYFQRDNNAFYVRPQSNNDYEQYVKGCGPYFPPSSVVPGGWVGSGISCSNDPTFNTFPSCYGREYYFDCCGTVPQLRIIVASPTVQNITGKMGGLFGTCATGVYVCTWTYQKSTGNSSLTEQVAHYNWVASTIQGAYIAGLPYTMVVTFDQCLSVSGEECGQGYHHQSSISDGTLEADLLNLLLNNQVGGHRLTFLVNAETNSYERFYPLAVHPNTADSDGFGCLYDGMSNHGITTTRRYFYDSPVDTFPIFNPACFANPTAPGAPYSSWPGLAGYGVSPIAAATFGQAFHSADSTGEILVKDTNGNGLYDLGEPYIAGPQPVPGTALTGSQGTNTHLGFIDSNGNGQWEPGETLLKDANAVDGCVSSTDCNDKFDPGETVYSGSVPTSQQTASFNNADVKLIDTNANGKWDEDITAGSKKVNGSPHNALEAPYVATAMGLNTTNLTCNDNNKIFSTTCPGHGWVNFGFTTTGNKTDISTSFCRDGEKPTSNYASCTNPHVYNDRYVVVSSTTASQELLTEYSSCCLQIDKITTNFPSLTASRAGEGECLVWPATNRALASLRFRLEVDEAWPGQGSDGLLKASVYTAGLDSNNKCVPITAPSAPLLTSMAINATNIINRPPAIYTFNFTGFPVLTPNNYYYVQVALYSHTSPYESIRVYGDSNGGYANGNWAYEAYNAWWECNCTQSWDFDFHIYVWKVDPLPVTKGLSSTGSFLGTAASLNAFYITPGNSATWTAWITATNTTTAQVFAIYSAGSKLLTQSSGTYYFVYQFNTTTTSNPGNPWVAFACSFNTAGGTGSCRYERTPDVEHDGAVNILDVATCALANGSHPGDSKWNMNCDLNNDGVVDIADISYISFYFGTGNGVFTA